MGKNVTFKIEVTMNERWVDDFCSMLHYMESCGNMGHSSMVGFYADGDGDFRPKFKIEREYNEKKGFLEKDMKEREMPEIEVFFDAG